jgi:hypothetical protein
MDGPKRYDKFRHTDGKVYKIDQVHYQIGLDTFRVTARRPDGTVLGAKITTTDNATWHTDTRPPRTSAFVSYTPSDAPDDSNS